MRTRIGAFVLSVMLAAGWLGCSKKDNTQTSQNQPATQSQPPADQSANMQNQNATPSGAAAPSQPVPSSQEPQREARREAAPPPAPAPVIVPSGTSLVIRMGNTISSKTANVGDSFSGTLTRPVTVNGQTVIPAGSTVTGTVTDAKNAGRFKGAGYLSITLNSITVNGVPAEISTSTYSQSLKGKGKRTATMIGGGAGLGALVGGLAGGGKGAAIGALAGGGAGTAGSALTGNKVLVIPAESAVTFRLTAPLTVRR